jgi:hypothetical protein
VAEPPSAAAAAAATHVMKATMSMNCVW